MKLNLRDLLGDKFTDDITVEQLLELSSNIEVADPNNSIDLDTYNKLKNANDKTSREAKEWKTKYNSTLSEQEQLNIEREEQQAELQAKYDELVKKTQIMEYTNKFLSVGYSDKLAQSTAEAYVNGDIDTFFDNQKKFTESVKKNERNTLLQSTPKPDGGEDKKGITKEDLKKMSVSEINEFARNNPSEYQAIYNTNKE